MTSEMITYDMYENQERHSFDILTLEQRHQWFMKTQHPRHPPKSVPLSITIL